jgi:hypothetical protein
MTRSVLLAIVAFAVCFTTGTTLQLLLRRPPEPTRRTHLAGLATCTVIAVVVYLFLRR